MSKKATPSCGPAPESRRGISCGCAGTVGEIAGKRIADQSHRWRSGEVKTAVGPVPKVLTGLVFTDRLGSWKVRWGIGRAHHAVQPALYAVGEPNAGSPVFVSANYRMSFDRLRESLAGVNGWILVLDTKGINVWCAAGKGAFGTDEVVRRVEETGLARVVSHRILVLPQLSAPGVAAAEVYTRCGFQVVFGPVRAHDIRSFMDAGVGCAYTLLRSSFRGDNAPCCQ